MWVRVRSIDGRLHCRVAELSRRASVASLKARVASIWRWAPEEDQRLFFAGKELQDDAEIFEYGVKVNDVVQLVVRGGGGGGEEEAARMMRRKLKVSDVFSHDLRVWRSTSLS